LRIPSFKKILIERFADNIWIKQLLDPLNSFMDDMINGLNNQLTITENLAGEVKVVKVTGDYPVKLSWGPISKPTIGLIGKIETVDRQPFTLSTPVTLLWSFTQSGQVSIDDLVGLDDSLSKQYDITLVFLVK